MRVLERVKLFATPVAVRVWRRRGFLGGVLCGVILVFATRWLINRSTVPDRLVAPLLVADTSGPAQAIVVLGASVVGECTPNLNGFRRVMLAARLWREKRAPLMVFTGGTGQGSCPVAVPMSQLAREVGVPDESIRIEVTSHSTKENGQNSAPLLRAAGVSRVLVVTDRLHMRRAAATFEHFGFEVERASVPVYEGHINNVDMLASGSRELVALAYYRMRGWTGFSLRGPSSGSPANGSGQRVNRPGSIMHGDIRYPSGPLVILGASYAGRWDLKTVGDIPVVNRGITGQQSFEMLERFERDVVQARPRAVLIWGHINDIFRAPVDVSPALDRIRESYVGMVALARRHRLEPILATEVTMRSSDSWSETLSALVGRLMGKEGYQDRINRHVMDTNRWLAELARREGLQLLDFQAALGDEAGRRRREFTAEDGSHITTAGYAALTAYAAPILESHFAQRQGGSVQ